MSAKPKAAGPKIEAPKSEQQKPWSKYNKPLADPELEKLVREWAEEGIEFSAGKSGDDLDVLRKEQVDRGAHLLSTLYMVMRFCNIMSIFEAL